MHDYIFCGHEESSNMDVETIGELPHDLFNLHHWLLFSHRSWLVR